MEELSIDKKYLTFIEDLILKLEPLMPEDINKLQQDYLMSNIRKSAMILAQSMEEEEIFSRIDYETQCTYIQIMGEWSFHKEIDLFRSGIPAKYWKDIMQRIWAVMWDVMYACIENEASEDVLLNVIEKYVGKTYIAAIEELREADFIDEMIEQQAKSQSNIRIMAIEYVELREFKEKIKKICKHCVLFAIIAVVVSFLILQFKNYGIIIIFIFLIIYNIYPKINKDDDL